MSGSRAKDIHQATLDVIGSAILQGDMEVCDRYIGLPLQVAAQDASTILHTRDAVRDWIRHLRATLIVRGATSLTRRVETSEFTDADTIQGRQLTEIRRNGDLIVPVYVTRTVLVLSDGRWQIRATESAIPNADWPLVASLPSPAA